MCSPYFERLSGDARTRYLDKIAVINSADPYAMKNLNPSVLPSVEPTDLVNYLVLGTSAYTTQQFKAYRSLESYNQFLNGWVKDIAGCMVENFHVVVAKVCTINNYS